ncbi:MAG: TIR domain-containing protein [Hyphomonas sp.]|nr:TIR domain-containing protein [Hyphomonas sp.]
MFRRRRIFLSHSSNDDALADVVTEGLTRRGVRVFADHDEKYGITPGEEWLAALSRHLKKADAVIVLVTDPWKQSQWCQAEYKTTKLLNKAVIPIALTAQDAADFESRRQKVIIRPDVQPTDDVFLRIRRGIPRKMSRLVIMAALAAMVSGFLALGFSHPAYGKWDLSEYAGGAFMQLQRDPLDPQDVFAMDTGALGHPGLFVTSDCGEEWTEFPIPADTGGSINRVSITKGEILLATDNGLWSLDRAVDASQDAWKLIETEGLSHAVLVAVSPPDRPDQFFYGTQRPGGASAGAGTSAAAGSSAPIEASSHPGGTGFVDRSTNEVRGLSVQLNDIAFHPSDPDIIVMAAANDGLFYSKDRLRTVRKIDSYSGSTPLTVYFARDGRSLLVGDRDGLYKVAWPDNEDTQPVATRISSDIRETHHFSQGADGRIYVASLTGLYSLDDDFTGLVKIAPALPVRHVNQALECGSSVLLATGGAGVLRLDRQSMDMAGQFGSEPVGTYAGIRTSNYNLVSTPFAFWFGAESPVIETNANATSFLVVSGPASASGAADRSQASRAFHEYAESRLLAGMGNGLILAKDAGETVWSRTYEGEGVVNALVASAKGPATVLAVLNSRRDGPVISHDGGATWTQIPPLPAVGEVRVIAALPLPDGRFLLSGTDGSTTAFDADTNVFEAVGGAHEGIFTGGALVGGRLVLVSSAGEVGLLSEDAGAIDTLGRIPLPEGGDFVDLVCCNAGADAYAISQTAGIWRLRLDIPANRVVITRLLEDQLNAENKVHGASAGEGDLPVFYTEKGVLVPSEEFRVCRSDDDCHAWSLSRLRQRLESLVR